MQAIRNIAMKPRPLYSLLHATRGRPAKAIAAMSMAIQRAANPGNVQYIFACDWDDPCKNSLLGHGSLLVVDQFKGSAPAWDAIATVSEGEILIQMQDDLEPPFGWDSILLQKIITSVGFDWPFKPVFVAASDGYRKDAICCTAIMNRCYRDQKGEFLHAGYQSVFSDDEVTYRALRDARDGKCTFVDARDLVFLHRHHLHDSSVPDDETYRRENSAEAYRIGGALFAERNPKAATDGLRTWQ